MLTQRIYFRLLIIITFLPVCILGLLKNSQGECSTAKSGLTDTSLS